MKESSSGIQPAIPCQGHTIISDTGKHCPPFLDCRSVLSLIPVASLSVTLCKLPASSPFHTHSIKTEHGPGGKSSSEVGRLQGEEQSPAQGGQERNASDWVAGQGRGATWKWPLKAALTRQGLKCRQGSRSPTAGHEVCGKEAAEP